LANPCPKRSQIAAAPPSTQASGAKRFAVAGTRAPYGLWLYFISGTVIDF
jgi:hypothetical protein